MSKSSGYFQNFPAVDLKIESNNKRGYKKSTKVPSALTREQYSQQTDELFPNLHLSEASSSVAASNLTAANAQATSNMEPAANNQKKKEADHHLLYQQSFSLNKS